MKMLPPLTLMLLLGASSDIHCAEKPSYIPAEVGPGIRRIANMPDGAPAFELRNTAGVVVSRIECLNNGWYDPDEFSARLLGSREFMATVIAKNGHLDITEVGPASFNCVVVEINQNNKTIIDKKEK